MHLLVRDVRLRKGLTQLELATRAGCSRELISSIETCRYSPNVDRLADIAVALEVPLQELFPPAPRPGRPRRLAGVCQRRV